MRLSPSRRGLLPSLALGERAIRRPFKWYTDEDEEIYYTVIRSDGSDGTGANRQMVSFDYGIPTGQSLASIQLSGRFGRAQISAVKWRTTCKTSCSPIGNNEGERSSERALAWWDQGRQGSGRRPVFGR